MMDVVYVLKDCWQNEELKYSLRTLKNMPVGKVWIYGAKLDWFSDEINSVQCEQCSGTKWANVNSMLKLVCLNKNITKDFILMNDDFFVMKKIDYLPNYSNATLKDRFGEIIRTSPSGTYSRYMKGLLRAEMALEESGYETKNFELHIPMTLNRRNLYRILIKYPNSCARRSLYGNIYDIKTQEIKDCKIYHIGKKPADTTFLSTTDLSFQYGKVGEYIRKQFNEKSIYER